MSTEKIKRGLGDNSQNYQTWGEILTDLCCKVSELGSHLIEIKAMHKASHGHEYTFEDEIDEKRTCRPNKIRPGKDETIRPSLERFF